MDTLNDIEPIIERLLPLINQNEKRLCHKIRTARYYGGIATIDVVGCYLDCAFCWVPEFKRFPEEIERRLNDFKYLTPQETSDILINLARKNGLKSVRLSGGEPTLNMLHLLDTIKLTTDAGYNYILETNGLLLNEDVIDKLAKYRKKMYVYYSLKGTSPEMFLKLTSRSSKYWDRTLDSLNLLINSNFTIGINLISDFLNENKLLLLIEKLIEIDEFAPLALDIKQTSIFPHVKKRLEDRKISYSNYRIDKIEFGKIMRDYYPEVYKRGNPYRINMGIMNFFDFGRANHERNI